MRLIDVHELDILGHLEEFPECESDKAWNAAVREICTYVDLAPTVDAVVVTRCKDCEHAERYERADGTAGYYCGHPQNAFTYGERWDRAFKPAKEADDFCSYGE